MRGLCVGAVVSRKSRFIIGYGLEKAIRQLKGEMKEAAKKLEFEKAARLRDQIKALTDLKMEMGNPAA
jgi:excinuclease ABC subunit B